MAINIKNKIERAIENFTDLRDRVTDSQLNDLLDSVVSALESVEDRLEQMENEPADFDHEGSAIAISQNSEGFAAEVDGVPTGDRYPSYAAAVDGAIGFAMSLE